MPRQQLMQGSRSVYWEIYCNVVWGRVARTGSFDREIDSLTYSRVFQTSTHTLLQRVSCMNTHTRARDIGGKIGLFLTAFCAAQDAGAYSFCWTVIRSREFRLALRVCGGTVAHCTLIGSCL